MSDELKPCECGSPPERVGLWSQFPPTATDRWFIICLDCDRETATYPTKEAATEAWNTRKEPTP